MPRVLDLDGKPDAQALQAAFNLLAERHEALRTRYKLLPTGVPVGEVVPASEFSVPLEVVPTTSDAEVDAALVEENSTPFDFATGPMIRARLLSYTFSPGATLVVTMHHAVGDACEKAAALEGAAPRGGWPYRGSWCHQLENGGSWQSCMRRGSCGCVVCLKPCCLLPVLQGPRMCSWESWTRPTGLP